MKRRGVLAALVGSAAAALLPSRTRAAPALLRPPGALAPGAFEQACIGCYRCAEVCPPKAILFTGSLTLDTATPYIDAAARACVLCMKCTEVCPTRALLPIAATHQAVQESVRMGVPRLERERCLPWAGRGICRMCYYACPYADQAVELVGPQQAPLFHAEACVGCGLCEEACPRDAHAVTIVPWAQRETAEPKRPQRGPGKKGVAR